jgi:DNA-binding CsgD family transcriptional regulator
VGRTSEMDILSALLDGVAGGSGGTVFLSGAAGLGKTRLARETQLEATRRDMLVMRGRAVPSMPYRAVTEALLGVLRTAGPHGTPELTPYRAALSRLVPEWGPDRPAGADDQPIVLAEAVLRLLTTLARGRGCLLILEDLHDADADTLMIVDYLADNIGGEPLLMLGTMRPGSDATGLAYAAEQRHSAAFVELGPLGADAVRQMSAECLGLPPADVPHYALQRVDQASGGVPFFVEELLTAMVDDRTLVRDGDRWSASAAGPAQVPAAVRASVVARTRRLAPDGHRLLLMAAVYDQPCPGMLLGAAAGLHPAGLVEALRAAVDAQLLLIDQATGRYVVQHALVSEALRASTLPEDLAALSGSAAAAIEETYPDLPDEWCVGAARLWQQAGDLDRAARLFHRAGRRAAERGAVRTAIDLLERGLALIGDNPVLVATLLDLLVVAGEVPRARQLAAQLDRHATASQRAAVHLRLARAAVTAGQWDIGRRELDQVRDLTGDEAGADIDVMAAQLADADQDAGRLRRAEALALRALDAAGRAGLPEIACEALELLGRCARVRDLGESDVLFTRGLAHAGEHGLTLWRLRFLFHRGAHAAIRHADDGGLLEARETALRAGAVITALDADAELAVLYLTRGEYHLADANLRRCEQTGHRLGLDELRQVSLGLRICVAAHQGRRDEVDALLPGYDRLGGRQSAFNSALNGLGLALCSLLEEDRDRARAELTDAVTAEADKPPEYLSLVHGLHLAVAVLAGDAGRPAYEALAGSARGQAGWNRQFVLLAGAVLAGRDRRGDLAEALMTEFEQVAAPYPLGRHLGLRLAAQAAVEDGWGRPGPWLRAAEQHFHAVDAPRVAAACRALLRQAGESAPQRRPGVAAIPPTLRRAGVTAREYEVLALVAEHLTNHEIGRRLFVSPRTVETHVTRLLAKTGQPDRSALARHATTLSVTAHRSVP